MVKYILLPVLAVWLLSSCRFTVNERVKGNGNVTTTTMGLKDFTGIDVSGMAKVYITQGSDYSVRVETDENLHPYMVVEVDGGILRIRQRDHVSMKVTQLNVYVSGPVFNRLQASGACRFYSENELISPDRISIDMSGASHAVLEIKTPQVNAELSGAGTIELKGETRDLELDGSGSADFKCFELKAENVSVDISGAGSADVFASVKLQVDVSGAGHIRYQGDPTVSKHISGAGSVKKVE